MNTNYISSLFDRIDFKVAVRNGIGAGLSLFVGNLLSQFLERPNPIVSSLWICLTAILILQAHLGGTYRSAWTRFLGLVVGTIVGGAMTSWLGTDPFTLSISIALTIIICSILKLQESFRIAIATVAVIMIVWELNPNVSPWLFSIYRFIDSCFGLMIGVGIAHTIWPFHAREKLRLNMAEAIANLGCLCRSTIQEDQPGEEENQATLKLIKQIDDSLYSNRQILEDSKAELVTQSAKVQDWVILLSQVDELFEQIVAMRHVYKPDTLKVFDEQLRRHFQDVIDKINTSFVDVSLMLETRRWNTTLPDLEFSLIKLKEELERFRGTKVTRQLAIEEVESFFVFFYSLKTLLKLMQRVECTVHKLIDEESF